MQRLVDLLVDLRRCGVAVVVIEHHMDLIMTIADRIVVIDQGRKLAEEHLRKSSATTLSSRPIWDAPHDQ